MLNTLQIRTKNVSALETKLCLKVVYGFNAVFKLCRTLGSRQPARTLRTPLSSPTSVTTYDINLLVF